MRGWSSPNEHRKRPNQQHEVLHHMMVEGPRKRQCVTQSSNQQTKPLLPPPLQAHVVSRWSASNLNFVMSKDSPVGMIDGKKIILMVDEHHSPESARKDLLNVARHSKKRALTTTPVKNIFKLDKEIRETKVRIQALESKQMSLKEQKFVESSTSINVMIQNCPKLKSTPVML
jgi:hypothetical protein